MSKRIQRQGFTLIEVMIFSVISLMLLGLLAQFFIVATRRTEDSRLRVDTQQTAILILKKFERDIAFTSQQGMVAVLGATKYAISVTPTENTVNADGSARWKLEHVLYIYDAAEKTLIRERVVLGEPAASDPLYQLRPFVPTSTDLETLATAASDQKLVLSKHVEEFSLQDGNGSTTAFQTQPLNLTLRLRRPLSTSERFAEFTVNRRYALRNSF